MDLEELTARQARMAAAVADLADLPWNDLPADAVDSILCTLESAHRTQESIGHDAINPLRTEHPHRSTRRLRDHPATHPNGATDIDRHTLNCQDANLATGPTDQQWQARRRYDDETLGQTLWYPPKSVDPTRHPATNRHHRRPNKPREPNAA